MSLRESVEQLAHNPKVAGVVSAATTGTGAGTVLDFIPDDIGKIATILGIILSTILIRIHIVNLKKVNLELDILKRKAAKEEVKPRQDADSIKRV